MTLTLAIIVPTPQADDDELNEALAEQLREYLYRNKVKEAHTFTDDRLLQVVRWAFAMPA